MLLIPVPKQQQPTRTSMTSQSSVGGGKVAAPNQTDVRIEGDFGERVATFRPDYANRHFINDLLEKSDHPMLVTIKRGHGRACKGRPVRPAGQKWRRVVFDEIQA
jgi:hypothetical protein